MVLRPILTIMVLASVGRHAVAASPLAPRPPQPAVSPASPPKPSATLWQGTQGPITTVLTVNDLTVTSHNGGKDEEILSLAKYAQVELDNGRPDPADKDPQTDSYNMSLFITPLSLVGPLLSLRVDSNGFGGGAHPYANSSFTVLDLAKLAATKPKDPFQAQANSLSQLIAPDVLLATLSADPFLRHHLQAGPFKTLSALLAANPATDDDACAFRWSESALQSFAFYSLNKGKLGIRLGLSHGCEVQRGNLTQIGLEVPVPAALRQQLADAALGKDGFLMDYATKHFGKKVSIGGGWGD